MMAMALEQLRGSKTIANQVKTSGKSLVGCQRIELEVLGGKGGGKGGNPPFFYTTVPCSISFSLQLTCALHISQYKLGCFQFPIAFQFSQSGG